MRPNFPLVLRFALTCLVATYLGACSTQPASPEESLQTSDESSLAAVPSEAESADASLGNKNRDELEAAASSNDFTDPNEVQLNGTATSTTASAEPAVPTSPDETALGGLTAPTDENTPIAPDLLNNSDDRTSIASSGARSLVPFAKNSTRLNREFRGQLRELAKQMKSDSSLKISVMGHCDNRGNAAYNKRLALKRAKTVKAYLIKLGIKSNRILVKSFGKDKLLALGDSEQDHAQNRRVEIEFQ